MKSEYQNKFEVDLGNVEIDEKRRKSIAEKIQKVVLAELAEAGIQSDFSARLLSPGKFRDILIWGMWIDPSRRDDIFKSFIDRQ